MNIIEKRHYISRQHHICGIASAEHIDGVLAVSDILQKHGIILVANQYGQIEVKTRDEKRNTVINVGPAFV